MSPIAILCATASKIFKRPLKDKLLFTDLPGSTPHQCKDSAYFPLFFCGSTDALMLF